MTQKLHDNEILIDDTLVQQLVSEQFPNWSDLPLRQLGASGSSNLLYQLGDEYLIRLPRQPGGGQTISKEHTWQSMLGRHLRVSTPEIIALGEPSEAFPETWAVQLWLRGNRVEAASNANRFLAEDLADVIKELRAMPLPDLVGKELRPYRGKPLRKHDRLFRHNVEDCREITSLDLDFQKVLKLWEEALEQPETNSETWFHSDLVAENLLTDDENKLTAVLDFGGLGVGDPAIDLHGAWEMFTQEDRERFRAAMNVSEPEWLRGRAWAMAIPLMTFTYYWHTMPGRIHDRLKMIQAILAED